MSVYLETITIYDCPPTHVTVLKHIGNNVFDLFVYLKLMTGGRCFLFDGVSAVMGLL